LIGWLLILWQLPQTLVLALARRLLRAEPASVFRGIPVYQFRSAQLTSVALGRGILINQNNSDAFTLPHEYGHCRQSRWLGLLYLLVVGVPSTFWNLLSRWSPRISAGYYKRWPENWADSLGGVRRG